MILVFCAYVATHFLAYFLILRHTDTFRGERTIFLYHFLPAVVISLLVVTAPLVGFSEITLAAAVLVISLHGIYSLSFLELWSLAQGGYSISILISVDAASRKGMDPDFSVLESIGAGKRTGRLEDLQRLGLIRRRDGMVRLTPIGIVVANFFGLMAWLADIKQTG